MEASTLPKGNGESEALPTMPQQVYLREFRSTDVDYVMGWWGDDEVAKFLKYEAFRSRQQAKDLLEGTLMCHPWCRAICICNQGEGEGEGETEGEGEVIGSIALTRGTDVHYGRAELGFVLAHKYWGKGLMTSAVKLALDAGFHELKLHRIEAFTLPENVGCQKVLEKSGFVREAFLHNYVLVKGKIRDMIMFGAWPPET